MAYSRNVPGQGLGFILLNVNNGTILPGMVGIVIHRIIDGVASAGTGAITEPGGTGHYWYAMSQADTNGSDISFTFTVSGAIPVEKTIVTDNGGGLAIF